MSYFPCGYAVDLLRSCYCTKVRFYNGDPTTDDLEWHFTDPHYPVLTTPSRINSLNWVDATERVDHPEFAGEVPGTRKYSKGMRNVGLRATTYCGGVADWIGNGVRPPTPPVLDAFGVPQCCGQLPGLDLGQEQALHVDSIAGTYSGVEGVGLFMARGSEFSFSHLAMTWPFYLSPNPCQLDLYYAIPNGSGTYDFLSDFSICEFPGYAPFICQAGSINYDTDFGPGGESLSIVGQWLATGPADASTADIQGVVLSDGSGTTLAYLDLFAASIVPGFRAAGDFFNLYLRVGAYADFP